MLTKLFQHHHGYLQSKDLMRNRKLQYALQAMMVSGEVEQLRRGLYKNAKFANYYCSADFE